MSEIERERWLCMMMTANVWREKRERVRTRLSKRAYVRTISSFSPLSPLQPSPLSLTLSLSLSHSTFSFLNPQSNGVPLASFDASKTSHSMLYLCTLCRLKPSSLSLATSFCALQVSLSPPCVAHLCTRDCRNNEGGRRGGGEMQKECEKVGIQA